MAIKKTTRKYHSKGDPAPRPSAVTPELEGVVRQLISRFDPEPDRQGLADTPRRLLESYDFLTSGYGKTLSEVVGDAVFDEKYESMVIVKDIELYSTCEHHLLPFVGKCHVAYLPKNKLVGLSKIPRIVEMYARRFQLQERLTVQIAEALESVIEPHGVGVIIEAQHLCMMMRGVEKQNSKAVTSCMLGTFKRDLKTWQEFLRLIGR